MAHIATPSKTRGVATTVVVIAILVIAIRHGYDMYEKASPPPPPPLAHTPTEAPRVHAGVVTKSVIAPTNSWSEKIEIPKGWRFDADPKVEIDFLINGGTKNSRTIRFSPDNLKMEIDIPVTSVEVRSVNGEPYTFPLFLRPI